MRRILQILLALVFVLHASLAAAAPPCAHCQDMDCPVAQCMAAGCATFAMPALPVRVAAAPAMENMIPAVSPVSLSLPVPMREVWTPPD
jgi:hypothetical protein